MLSTELLDAPSISMTSREVPSPISTQIGSSGSNSALGPPGQLRALARIRAVVVLPVPRGPTNSQACARRLRLIALRKVEIT